MPHLDESTIHEWLDGAMSDSDAAAAEAHVAVCAECAEAVAEARGLIAASSRILSALDHVPGGVLPEAARDAEADAASAGSLTIPDLDARRRTARRRSRWRWGSPQLAAAAVLMVAVGSWAVLRSSGEQLAVESVSADASGTDSAAQVPAAPSAPEPAELRAGAAVPVAPDPAPTARRESAPTMQRFAKAESSAVDQPVATSDVARKALADAASNAGQASAAAGAARRGAVPSATGVAAAPPAAVRDSVMAGIALPSAGRLRDFAPTASRAQALAIGTSALALEPSAWIDRCFQTAIEPATVSPSAIAEFSRLTAALPREFMLDSVGLDERGDRPRFAAIPKAAGDSTISGWWSVAADSGILVEFSSPSTDRVQVMIAQSAADWPTTRASLFAYGSRRATTLSVQLSPIVCSTSPVR